MFGMLPFERNDNDLFGAFDNFTKSFFKENNASLPAFRTDIQDKGDHFLLEADLPGFHKEDIALDLKDGILTVTAHHDESTEHKDKSGYIRRERQYGSFQRSFDISGIDESGITAAYNNGVLELKLPKAQAIVPESKKIAIQ